MVESCSRSRTVTSTLLAAVLVGVIAVSAGAATLAADRFREPEPKLAPAGAGTEVEAVLDSAAAALGMAAFREVERFELRAEGSARWTGQGASPQRPTRHRRFERWTVLDRTGDRMYQRHLSLYPDGTPIFCSTTIARGETVLAYDCLSRALEPRPGTSASAVLDGWESFRPYGWIELARSRASEVELVDASGRETVLVLELGGTERRLHLDDRSRLLRRVEWRSSTPLGDTVTEVLEYDDYRDVGGWRYPHRIVYRNPGGNEYDFRYRSLRVDGAMPDSLFATPADARPVDPVTDRGPRLERLAEGVYQIRHAVPTYNVMFVETDGYVVVLDAPGDDEAARRVLRTIEKELPGVPIRYVVPSHFHHDHLSGLRPFVARGATVVTTGANVELVRRTFGDAAPGRGGGSGTDGIDVEAVRARKTLGSGPRRIVLHAVDGRPHVNELLLPHLPGAGILYVADLFWRRPTGLIRPADRETEAFREILDELGLEPRRIVLAHGDPVTLSDVSRAFRLRPGIRP